MSLIKLFRIVALLLVGVVAVPSASAGRYKVVYSFSGSPDGAGPAAGVIRDAAGNFFGTTNHGGTFNLGTIFKVDTTGKETVLYSFGSGNDGVFPDAGLALDSQGNLYGTTNRGGGSANCALGCGTVFKFDTDGKLTVLHSFSGSDGAWPVAGVILDSAGNLYGITQYGGASNACDSGCGVVFKLNHRRKNTVLHSFTRGADGATPMAGLVRDSTGNLYGTTVEGGVSDSGTAFKIDPNGSESILHSFEYGDRPESSLLLDSSGNLYGTKIGGGDRDAGAIYRLDAAGNETILYSFKAVHHHITYPRGLARDNSGNLYGTTLMGGAKREGTVFKLDSRGAFTVLHTFAGNLDGGEPGGDVILDPSGKLWGTSGGGGSHGFGAVFRLMP